MDKESAFATLQERKKIIDEWGCHTLNSFFLRGLCCCLVYGLKKENKLTIVLK